jgi:hypothetical protein
MAYGRRRRGGGGIDEGRLYEDIKRAQDVRVGAGQRIGREATEAARGAAAIELGKLADARGIGGTNLEEALRGAVSSAEARTLSDAEARRNAQLLEDVEAIGPRMLEREAGKVTAREEKKLARASEAGTFASMLASLGGLGAAAGSALPSLIPAVAAAPATALTAAVPAVAAGGPAALPLLIGGLIASGFGSAVSGAAGAERGKVKRRVADIGQQVAGFDMPGTEGYAQMLSSGPGYEGFSTSFLGGPSGERRRRRFGEEAVDEVSPYSMFT